MHMTKDLLEEEEGLLKFNNVLDTVITLSIIAEEAKEALAKSGAMKCCAKGEEEESIDEYFSDNSSSQASSH